MDTDLAPVTPLVGVAAAIDYAADLVRDAVEELAHVLTWSDGPPDLDDISIVRSGLFDIRHEIDALQNLVAAAVIKGTR